MAQLISNVIDLKESKQKGSVVIKSGINALLDESITFLNRKNPI